MSEHAKIDADGTVRDGGRVVDRIPLPPGTHLLAGALETSTVNPIGETLAILTAQRAFETAQKTLLAIDATRDKDGERRGARAMNRAMYAAASGMAAQQTQLEIVADNLANADVAGFKSAAATFADVRAGSIGLGTTGVGKHAVFAQGKLVRSGGAFDVAIDGPGFFVVERGSAHAYTRNGEFARERGRHAAQQRGLGAVRRAHPGRRDRGARRARRPRRHRHAGGEKPCDRAPAAGVVRVA